MKGLEYHFNELYDKVGLNKYCQLDHSRYAGAIGANGEYLLRICQWLLRHASCSSS